MLDTLPRDVLDEICEALIDCRKYGYSRMRTEPDALLSLARTSRLLHEPAVGSIWKRLPSIAPLIYTLPDDLWLETGFEGKFVSDEVRLVC